MKESLSYTHYIQTLASIKPFKCVSCVVCVYKKGKDTNNCTLQLDWMAKHFSLLFLQELPQIYFNSLQHYQHYKGKVHVSLVTKVISSAVSINGHK